MTKEEKLLFIQNLINSGEYDIEILLEQCPNELLKDVLEMIKKHVQQESVVIGQEIRSKAK